MSTLIWNLYSKHRSSSAIFIAALFGGILTLALFWIVSGVLMTSKTRTDRAGLQKKTAALAAKKNDLASPHPMNAGAVTVGYQVVEKLHAALVADCAAEGKSAECTVSQFTSTTSPVGFVSQFGVNGANFGSFHVRITLTGELGTILSAMHKLADCEVPFEYSSMSISPAAASSPGGSGIASVSLEMNVLTSSNPNASAGGPTS